MSDQNLTQGIEVYKSVAGTDIVIARDPEVVLAEAQKAAAALKRVIAAKPKPVIFNNEQYLEFEDWQTVAKFYGCTAKVLYTRYVEYGDVRGFESAAVVIDNSGAERSSAEAMCLNDEANWGKRAKFSWKAKNELKPGEQILAEYQDKVKVKIGEEQVPLFQLRSMAQTRACAKALRNVFSWVVVLAGYQGTPAEELTGTEGDQNGHAVKPTPAPPQRKAAPPAAAAPPATNGNGKHSEPTPASSPDLGELLPTHHIKEVKAAEGTKNGKPWKKFTVSTDHGKYATFDTNFGDSAMFAWEQGFPVRITFEDKSNGKYDPNITTLEVVETAPPAPEEGGNAPTF